MSQTTRVYKLAAAEAASLEENLKARLPADSQWRQVPHARFSVKASDVVLTCYRSGKLVLQGRDLDGFSARFLGKISHSGARKAEPDMPLDHPMIASDEAGKGDYFGPLVVAAVYAEPSDADALQEMGVADSKTLSDTRVLTLAGRIEEHLEHQVVILDPEAYNSRYAAIGNLNNLLAQLHAEALEPLIRSHGAHSRVLVDKFAREEVLERALADRVSELPEIQQVPRAEAHLAVAAASILARASFLEGLKRSSDSCGTDLHKGAGDPVDRVARRVLEIGGMELLETVAKIHFKNTSKVQRWQP